jgi:hypothetical protein
VNTLPVKHVKAKKELDVKVVPESNLVESFVNSSTVQKNYNKIQNISIPKEEM